MWLLGYGLCGTVAESERPGLHGLEKLEDTTNSSIAKEKKFHKTDLQWSVRNAMSAFPSNKNRWRKTTKIKKPKGRRALPESLWSIVIFTRLYELLAICQWVLSALLYDQ